MTQHIYLVNAAYNEKKNEIICYFENNKEKLAKKFKFFPYINLPSKIDELKVREILKFYEIKNFVLEDKKIISKSYSDLIKISNLIAKLTNKKIIHVEPIRNFLIEKNWSYFDSFIKNDDLIIKTNDSFNFSNLVFKEIPFLEALKIDEENTNFILKKAVLSNLLKINIESVSKSLNNQTETLIENMFFKNKEYISWNNEDYFYSSVEFSPYGDFEKVSEIDFSSVWVKLITKDFFNIGENTINCDCCKPVKLEDDNLLSSTTIEVKLKENNLYFESSSRSFSSYFHKENNFKKERIERRKEFFLRSIPVGPFKKDELVKIPIIDAKILIGEEKVILAKDHTIYWHCKKIESSLSKEINELTKEILFLKQKNENFTNNIITLNTSFEKLFSSQKQFILSKLLYEIPFILTNPSSSFFTPKLARAITTMQEATISKFNEFSEKNGYRIIHYNKRNAFVRGYSPLILARNFAKELNMPLPIVASFLKKTSFR